MSRVAILGATGKLGDLLVARALDQGHEVHALARNPEKIHRHAEALTVFKGNAETGEGLEPLLDRCHYVISALASKQPVIEACYQQLIKNLAGHRLLKRVVFISRMGTGDSAEQQKKVSGPIERHLPRLLPWIFRDLNRAESVVRVSRLPWVIFRTTQLTDDPPSGKVTVVKPTEPPPHRMTRIDLAHWVIDHLEQETWDPRELTVGS